jgi:hypothetical protein
MQFKDILIMVGRRHDLERKVLLETADSSNEVLIKNTPPYATLTYLGNGDDEAPFKDFMSP